jgi:hypothetical protein
MNAMPMASSEKAPGRIYLDAVVRQLQHYKGAAESAIAQVSDDDLHWAPTPGQNSAAIQMQHVGGVLVSRWTDFLNSDGEKPDRNREAEFRDRRLSRPELMEIWNRGWDAMLSTLRTLSETDLTREVRIKGQIYTVFEAVERSLAHTAYHAGQIVMTAKMRAGERWQEVFAVGAAPRQAK